jgi:hypothetical protein
MPGKRAEAVPAATAWRNSSAESGFRVMTGKHRKAAFAPDLEVSGVTID